MVTIQERRHPSQTHVERTAFVSKSLSASSSLEASGILCPAQITAFQANEPIHGPEVLHLSHLLSVSAPHLRPRAPVVHTPALGVRRAVKLLLLHHRQHQQKVVSFQPSAGAQMNADEGNHSVPSVFKASVLPAGSSVQPQVLLWFQRSSVLGQTADGKMTFVPCES